ncbi:MAG: AEC family transporter [Hyphomicrobiales bacterium]
MQQVLTIILPVFAFMGLGWGAARTKFLGRDVETGLGAFTLWVAIPALLFRLMTESEPAEGSAWGLWFAFFLAAAVAWGFASALAVVLKRPQGTAASFGMGAAFGNTVMLGIPLALATIGERAVLPLALITAVHAPLLWLLSTVQIELAGSNREVPIAKLLRDLLVVLVKNPVISALIAGLLWRYTGLGLHPIVDDIITKLGQAAIPCALFAMGMSLATYSLKGELRAAPALTFIKLVIMPLCVWVLAYHVFDLPPAWAGTALILSAVPTGVNAYLFAVRYDCGVASVSGTIALSALVSVATLSVVIAFLGKT